jgi:hypothetical protein
MYEKFAPYSFRVVREKTKQLGQEYTPRQYMIQISLIAGFAGIVSYLYFYNLIISIIYALIALKTRLQRRMKNDISVICIGYISIP